MAKGLVFGGLNGGSGSGIKSIQRGTITMNTTTINIPINTVDTAKTIIILSLKPNLSGGTPGYSTVRGDVTGANTLTLTIGNTAYPPIVDWQIVEFTGIKSLQKGTKETSFAIDTVTINSVDVTKSILLFTYSSNDFTTTQIARYPVSLALTNSNTVTINQTIAVNKIINWQVIEFN